LDNTHFPNFLAKTEKSLRGGNNMQDLKGSLHIFMIKIWVLPMSFMLEISNLNQVLTFGLKSN